MSAPTPAKPLLVSTLVVAAGTAATRIAAIWRIWCEGLVRTGAVFLCIYLRLLGITVYLYTTLVNVLNRSTSHGIVFLFCISDCTYIYFAAAAIALGI